MRGAIELASSVKHRVFESEREYKRESVTVSGAYCDNADVRQAGRCRHSLAT